MVYYDHTPFSDSKVKLGISLHWHHLFLILIHSPSSCVFIPLLCCLLCCLLCSPVFSDFLCVCVSVYMNVGVHSCVCLHMLLFCVYVCEYLCMHLSICVSACVCVFACVWVGACFFSLARWEGHAGWWVYLWPFPLPAATLWRTQLRCACVSACVFTKRIWKQFKRNHRHIVFFLYSASWTLLFNFYKVTI